MSAPAGGCNLSGPDPQGLSPGNPKGGGGRQAARRHRDSPPLRPQGPLAYNSHSAGYQPPSSRINYRAGPVSLIPDTFYTKLILCTNSFLLLF